MIRCVILDFDGTLTDVDSTADSFVASYRAGLAARLGRSLEAEWQAAEARVLSAADQWGWEYEGKIVAPCHADPYILAGCTARALLDASGELADPHERQTALDATFREAYAQHEPVFRPELEALFDRLERWGGRVFVVTNSRLDPVQKRLGTLRSGLVRRLQVRGSARKFSLEPPASADALWEKLPETLALEGLSRPAYVRRGAYFDALTAIWREVRCEPDHTLVCGDILEMDLLLPHALGAHVQLLARASTRAYERQAAAALARGAACESLLEIAERL